MARSIQELLDTARLNLERHRTQNMMGQEIKHRDNLEEALLQGVIVGIERVRDLINTPMTEDFIAAVRYEAAHQEERWGTDHDAGKRPEDWVALLTYLLGKATKAHYEHTTDKLKHHIITVSSVCLNWFRQLNGEQTRMRPGLG